MHTGVAGIAQMATLALFPTIAMKIGRPKVFFAAMAAQVIGFGLLFGLGFVGGGYTAVSVGVCSAIVNIGVGFMLVLVTVSLADVFDYGE